MVCYLSRSGKFEPAKVRKSGEIGEGEEENNKIYVFLEKSTKNNSVFFHKTPKKICVRWNYAEAMLHFRDSSEFLLILQFDSSEFLYICS